MLWFYLFIQFDINIVKFKCITSGCWIHDRLDIIYSFLRCIITFFLKEEDQLERWACDETDFLSQVKEAFIRGIIVHWRRVWFESLTDHCLLAEWPWACFWPLYASTFSSNKMRIIWASAYEAFSTRKHSIIL